MNEWLLTNALGGFAMGGIPARDAAMNRRRYHGLLVAAASPPVGRIVALHSIVDEVTVRGVSASLATQQFAPIDHPVTHPDGYKKLEAVTVSPPRDAQWLYTVNRARLTRAVHLHPGRNAVDVVWTCDEPAQLRCRVFTPMRDFHALGHQDDQPPPAELVDEQTLKVLRWDLELLVHLTHGRWTLDGQWWSNFFYAEDRQRGQACSEDVWSPATFEATLHQPVTLHVQLVQPQLALPQPQAVAANTVNDDHATQRLSIAAEQFVVQRRMADSTWSTSIIAGYPWFADWGRDTMISLPGLLLCTGRHDQAKQALSTFARHMQNGLIPNRFDDYAGAAHYNTVDASLWFVHAVHALGEHRAELLDEALIDACREIVQAYRQGTDYNIAMQGDGLIAAGSDDTQLTWMDAKRDGITFTPRHGKAIEINALWHHALHCLSQLTNNQREADDLLALAELAAQSIRSQFWNAKDGCCFDVLSPESGSWRGDAAIRPNQIFAVSLSPSPLSADQQHRVLATVKTELLTPYGLRTLSRGHRDYKGRFEGDMMQRDAAYHQGTVWPWLIGPYAEAVLRVGRFTPAAVQEAREAIAHLLAELDLGCYGQLAEVYDGDVPHRPSGCPAQAWSVAEVLRLQHMMRS